MFHNVREDSVPGGLRSQNLFDEPGIAAEDLSQRVWMPGAGSNVIDQGRDASDAFGRRIAHPARGEAPDIGAFESGSEQQLLPCDSRLGARVPEQVSCSGGTLRLSGDAGDWVTLHFDDLPAGTYTLRVEVSGDGDVEARHTGGPEDPTDWNLPLGLASDPSVRWLGEVDLDGPLQVRLRRGDGGAVALHSVRLVPRFNP